MIVGTMKDYLETKDDESTCLVYTGLLETLEYLKIESVMGENKTYIWMYIVVFIMNQ